MIIWRGRPARWRVGILPAPTLQERNGRATSEAPRLQIPSYAPDTKAKPQFLSRNAIL